MIHKTFGIIGCGNMGESILRGIIERKVFPFSQIFISDVKEERISYIKGEYGVNTLGNKELVKNVDIILLSVKPQEIEFLLNEISPFLNDKLIISIAAGVKIEKIEGILEKAKVIRVMPNLCVRVKKGMSAFSTGRNVGKNDIQIAKEIFSSVGEVIEIKEEFMDAVTALSGSGPAYVFYFIEALIEAGEELGFSKDTAKLLSIKTLEGAIKLLGEEDPISLRKKVTSKGGTTEAAIKFMEENNLKGIIKKSLIKASERSKELSN